MEYLCWGAMDMVATYVVSLLKANADKSDDDAGNDDDDDIVANEDKKSDDDDIQNS